MKRLIPRHAPPNHGNLVQKVPESLAILWEEAGIVCEVALAQVHEVILRTLPIGFNLGGLGRDCVYVPVLRSSRTRVSG